MKNLLDDLLRQLGRADGGSKLVAALVGLALLAIVGVAGYVARRPDYQASFTGLSARESAAVSKALSDAAIAFRVSQPPGPFTVFVDEGDHSAALAAAYGAGALDKPLEGILTDSGVTSVFMGNAERMQLVQKRAWEEVEGMLEELDYVVAATVRAAPADSSPFGSKDRARSTASVTLTMLGDQWLTREQAMTVARLVSNALGVPEENLTIADHGGHSPYDPRAEEEDPRAKSLLAIKLDYDRRTSETVNRTLTDILGPSKARVTVSSEWEFEQSTTRTETSGKGGVLSESRNTTETPILGGSGAVGGLVGLDQAPPELAEGEEAAAPPAEPLLSRTSEERKEYQPTVTTTQSVRSQEVLKHQSIALYLDESIDEARRGELEAAIKASVGYVEGRDEFSRANLAFHVPELPEPAQGEAAGAAPSPWLELLLRRGIEIVAGVVFVVLLLKSLRASRGAAGGAAAATSSQPTADTVDPELLARAQVEELLRADPQKVGRILASWAREEHAPAGTRP